MSSGAPHIGVLPSGPLASIADVGSVSVGHVTLDQGPVQTGVTVVLPHQDDLFEHKVPAAATVINGFGKSLGLMQLAELGVLETPIALTNTFAVGTVANAQIRAACARHPEIGRERATVNSLVFECNDGFLNDIRRPSIQESHYDAALAACDRTFARGAVGAGRGMSCFELKGGIGSASRLVEVAGARWTVGVLVLANMGRLPQLVIGGDAVGARLQAQASAGVELGSIIILTATDAPLDSRQLRRLSVRAGAGLAKTGAIYGHGSGDISMAFSTAYTLSDTASSWPLPSLVADRMLDPLFQATADATEQAILDALYSAVSLTGRDGHTRDALTQRLRVSNGSI